MEPTHLRTRLATMVEELHTFDTENHDKPLETDTLEKIDQIGSRLGPLLREIDSATKEHKFTIADMNQVMKANQLFCKISTDCSGKIQQANAAIQSLFKVMV